MRCALMTLSVLAKVDPKHRVPLDWAHCQAEFIGTIQQPTVAPRLQPRPRWSLYAPKPGGPAFEVFTGLDRGEKGCAPVDCLWRR